MSSAQAGGFYGRRKGKRLRPGQESLVETLLPRLAVRLPGEGGAAPGQGSDAQGPGAAPPFDLPGLFAHRPETIRLEIGFGGGEHLAAQARAHPEIGFIGCEPFVNGMAKLLAVIDQEGLANIRLWDRDAAELLPALPPASLDRVDLLYPDPWPKRRQRKRRFVSDASLAALARVLRPGGLFRFASDIDDYAGWVLARALRSDAFRWRAAGPDDWRRPFPDWPGTRYEAKALAEGRRPTYLTFERI